MKKLLAFLLLVLMVSYGQADIIIRGNRIRFISGEEIRAEAGRLKFYDSFESTKTLTDLSAAGASDMGTGTFDKDANNIIDVSAGGTGNTEYTAGAILVAISSSTLGEVKPGLPGDILRMIPFALPGPESLLYGWYTPTDWDNAFGWGDHAGLYSPLPHSLLVNEHIDWTNTDQSFQTTRAVISKYDGSGIVLQNSSAETRALFNISGDAGRMLLYDNTGAARISLEANLTTDSWMYGNFNLKNGRLIGGIGAFSTSGTLDWNHITNATAGSGYSLIRSETGINCPPALSGGEFFQPFTFEYGTKNGTGSRTQFAIPYRVGYGTPITYGTSDSVWLRSFYSSAWSPWQRIPIEIDGKLILNKVGIGADADTNYPLYVYGAGGTSYALRVRGMTYLEGSATVTGILTTHAGVKLAGVYGNTTTTSPNLVIYSAGTVLRSTSSERYKKDIDYEGINPDWTLRLKPVSFTEKKTGKKHLGFISEDCAEIDSRLVNYNEKGEPEGLQTNAIIAAIAEQIKELNKRIEILEAE